MLLTQHVKLSKACTGKVFAKPQVLTVEDDARIQDIRFVQGPFVEMAFIEPQVLTVEDDARIQDIRFVQGPFVEMAFIESLTAKARQFAERGNRMSTPGF
ncbi:hypothetical protein HR11_02695 [Porphyromonas macacae]|nr:hypothetical protein HR11_02695 [Porphyromonas macacae]